MFETSLTLNTQKRPLSLTLCLSIRPAKSSQVKPSDVDSYGDYDPTLIAEMLATGPAYRSRITPEIPFGELDKVYQTFLA